MPIGVYDDEDLSFTNKEIQLEPQDMIYFATDGYVDQIGGPERKTYRSRYFKEQLLKISDKSLAEQKKILEKNINEWKGDIEQIDDILVMGIKV